MTNFNDYDPTDPHHRAGVLALIMALFVIATILLLVFGVPKVHGQTLSRSTELSAPVAEIFRLSGDGHFLIEAKPELIADKLFRDISRSYEDHPVCEGGVIWGVYKGTDHRTLVEAYVKDGAAALRTADSAEKEAHEVWTALRKLLSSFKATKC